MSALLALIARLAWIPEAGLLGVGCTDDRPVIDDDPVAILHRHRPASFAHLLDCGCYNNVRNEAPFAPASIFDSMILELLGITAQRVARLRP
jgi:hypothetical protein